MLDKINGKNLLLIFGTFISDGMASLLTYPKLKDSVTNDWPEVNGIDIDLADPHFDAREIKLKFWLIANNRDEFRQFYYGLFNELRQPGGIELYIDDLGQTFTLYYKEMTSVTKRSKEINSNHVGVEFEITFGEFDPYTNLQQDYLIDEFNNYIIG